MAPERPVALVTGAGQGLGRAACLSLARDGFLVIPTDVSEASAQATAELLGDRAPFWAACDVGSTVAVEAAFLRVTEELGRLNVLVSNAGIGDGVRSELVTDERWDKVISVNQTATLRVARAAFPLLRRSGAGAIINISSVVAHRGFPGRAAYAASKAAIEALTRVLAVEWGPYGIRVNCIAPGFIFTEGSRKVYESGIADADARAALTALGRLGEASEIGDVVAWLASPRASYVTGSTIVVDGGFLAYGRTGADRTFADDD